MSGHSKWSTIKRKKGAADQKRAAVFTKYGHNIAIAAREGGGDLVANFKLRLAVDAAKAVNMPKDNIERAIKRGTGELKDGSELFELQYEAFGPEGVALLIKVVSDNKNRAVSEIKHVLNKHNASLGAQGSVAWQFHEKGVLRISEENMNEQQLSVDDITLQAIDAGAEDVADESGDITIYTAKEDLQTVQEALESNNIVFEHSEVDWVPENMVDVDEKTTEKLITLFDALDDLEDVNDYYHNASMGG